MTPPSINVLYRVFQIRTPSGKGTSFTVEGDDDRQYLVTARHVVGHLQPGDRAELLHSTHGWVTFEYDPIPTQTSNADIAVLRLPKPIGPQRPIVTSTDGAVIGHEVFILGFPLGLHTALTVDGWILPFMKSGVIAGTDEGLLGVIRWWVDALGNPGFSGGPIVMTRENRPPQIIAVVSNAQLDESGENLGFVVGHPIDSAMKAIRESARK